MKKLTISRRDAEAQRFDVNNSFILFVASASLREMLLIESEFFHTFLSPLSVPTVPVSAGRLALAILGVYSRQVSCVTIERDED